MNACNNHRAESISFGLFLKLSISRTPHLSEIIFLDLYEKYKTQQPLTKTMIKFLPFLSYLTLNFFKNSSFRQVR